MLYTLTPGPRLPAEKNTRFNLRNADISIPRFNTVNYGKNSLRYFGARIWSKLDAGVKSTMQQLVIGKYVLILVSILGNLNFRLCI